MNTVEINLKIAEAKGLDPACLKHRYGMPKPIDYTTNPKLILENVIELLREGWVPRQSFVNREYGWFEERGIAGNRQIWNKDFGTATGLAWLEAFGGKDE